MSIFVQHIQALSSIESLRDYLDMISGPLQISTYGVPDYKELYDKAGVLEGGVISGLSPAAMLFMAYIGFRGKPDEYSQASNSLSKPGTGRRCPRSCLNSRDCPGDGDFLCVVDSGSFPNSLLLDGCCKSSYSSQVTRARQLLSNSSTHANKPSQAGLVPLAPFPISDFGCACNCTYVSQACCGAKDGLVSEPVSLKLGVLEPPNSTTCCDGGTGSFQTGPRSSNSTFC